MKKNFLWIGLCIAGIVALFLIVWCASLIKCEILTSKYHDDFEYEYQQIGMISDVRDFKVLSCNGKKAEVYYISDNDGNVVEFEMKDGTWVQTSWDTIWSRTGSASEVIWPYWLQFFDTGA
jgi:DNA-binding transcriptional regulator of glucitol operon